MPSSRVVLFLVLGLGVLASAGFLASCSTSSSCWPADANTYDAGSGGCSPKQRFDVCEVPSGTTVLADGGVDGPETCTDECSVEEFALICSAAPGSDDIPAP